jgi:hypothetical protein
MVKPVKVASLRIGDVEDVGIYAGFAIAEWEKTETSQALKRLNVAPTVWRSGGDPVSYGVVIDLWCEEYDPEDMAMARLCGLINEDRRVNIKI